MYLEHFGLVEEPFSIAPDPSFLFLSEAHNEALAHLVYGFTHGGFVLISGEVGTGKTTLLRNLLDSTPAEVDVAFILNPRLTVRELLETLCDELGVNYDKARMDSVKRYIDALNTHLLKTHEAGRSTVMVIDEAQILTPAVLEQIRLLTNLETNHKKLLRIILLGQPELVDMLNRTELRQLSQRVTARYHLTPLTRDDTARYVNHRLVKAGGKAGTFTSSALRKLYRLSRGTPRLINILADRALLGAYTRGLHEVSPALVAGAAREVFGTQAPRPRRFLPWIAGASAAVLIGAVGWAMLTTSQPGNRQAALTTPPAQTSASAPAQSTPRAPTPAPPAVQQATQPLLPPSSPAPAGTPQAVAQPAPVADTPAPQPQPVTQEAPPLPTGADAIVRPPGAGFATHRKAFQRVFEAWAAVYPDDETLIPCDFAPRVGLQCLRRSGGWSELETLNTPVVLELWDDDNAPFYGAITTTQAAGPDGRYYRLHIGEQVVLVQPRDLRDHWFGTYVLLWQTPPDYHGSLRLGDTHASVRWLRDSLATVQPDVAVGAADNRFDDALSSAVLTFQQRENLLADGVVGPLTWIKLSERLALPAPRLQR